MKKIASILLSMMMVFSLATGLAEGAAPAETEVTPMETIIGTITEVREDGSFIIKELDTENEVHVMMPEGFPYEAEWSIGLGDVVTVTYNGIMTRSQPPQITPEDIRSYTLFGEVEEVDADNNRILVNAEESGQVWVNLPEDAKDTDFEGKYVKVYFGGVMALSFPAQATAYRVEIVEQITGKVLSIAEEMDDENRSSFEMEWGDSTVLVHFGDNTKIITSFDEDDTVTVYYSGIMARSMPGQINALAIGMPRADEIG